MAENVLTELKGTEWNPQIFLRQHAALLHNNVDELLQKVDQLYKSENVQNLYARLAYILWGEGQKEQAHRLWQKEISLKSISWWNHQKYADTLVEVGRLGDAMEIIEQIYANSPEAHSGYSGLAWRIKNSDLEKALELFQKDFKLGRIRDEFLIKYTHLLAQSNKNFTPVLERIEDKKNQLKCIHQLSELAFVDEDWDKALSLLASAPFSSWFSSKHSSKEIKTSSKNLYAFYDLQACGPTFDFAVFICHAEKLRRDKKLEKIICVIVPASPDKFNHWYPATQSEQQKRLESIVFPCATLLPNMEITLHEDRDETEAIANSAQNIFPLDYSVQRPTNDFYFLNRQGKYPLSGLTSLKRDEVKNRLDPDKKLITITLRETNQIDKDRNSLISEWLRFIEELNLTEWQPVILRDFDKESVPLPDSFEKFNTFKDAVTDIPLRAALYQESFLNLGVNNGPMMLCLLLEETSCLIFKMKSSYSKVTCAEFLRDKVGLKEGEQFSFMSLSQKLVWKDDLYINIKEEVESFLKNQGAK